MQQNSPHLERGTLGKTTADQERVDRVRVFEHILIAVWVVIALYAIGYYLIGAQFSFLAMILGTIIFSPTTLWLNRKGYFDAARLALVTSGNFYIFLGSLGMQHEIRGEYYFVPSAMVAALMFEYRERNKVFFSLMLPFVLGCLTLFKIPQWIPQPDGFNTAWKPLIANLNFVGAFLLGMAFLNIFMRRIVKLKDQSIAEAQSKQLTAEKLNQVLGAQQKALLTAQAFAKVGSWRLNHKFEFTEWTPQMSQNLPGLNATTPPTWADFLRLLPTKEQTHLIEYLNNQSTKNKDKLPFETTFKTAENDSRWILLTASFVQDAQQSPDFIAGTCQDITEQRERDSKLKTIFDSIEVGVWEWDVSSENFLWDSSVYRIFRLSPTDFSSAREAWEKIIHPEDKARVYNHWIDALKGITEFDSQYRVILPGGEVGHYRSKATFVYDQDKKPRFVSGITLSTHQTALLELEKQQIAEALNQGAIFSMTDVSGKIIAVNEAFCKISQYEEQELVGSTYRKLRSGLHGESFYSQLWQDISQGKIWHGEIQNKAKDGSTYWLQTMILPARDLQGKIHKYIAVQFDITPQKNLQQSMVQSAKMASLGEMAGGVAHEINNPLAIISGKAGLLRKNIERGKAIDPQQLIADLNKIESTVSRIAKIVSGLRTFSRSAENDPDEILILDEVITDALSFVSERFKIHQIELSIDCPQHLFILGKSSQLSQVLINLLSNSFDAIQNQHDKWVKIDAQSTSTSVILNIRDSGQGIPKEVQDKIMQPFFTTKEVGKGTGLGLSISQGIIQAHKGKLYIDTASEHTCFVIELPLAGHS